MDPKPRKILYTASTDAHLRSFHLPYLEALLRAGCSVTAAAEGDGRGLPEGTVFFRVPFTKRMFSPRNVRASMALCGLLRREEFDEVICHTSLAAFFTRVGVMLSCRRPRVVNVVHGYLFDDDTPPLRRWALLSAERLARSVTDDILVMNAADEKIARQNRLCRGNVVRIPGMGVPMARYAPASAQERADPRTAFAAREALEEFGFSADPVLAFSDSRGRSTVEAFCSVVPREADYAALTERLYEKTGFSYLDPVTDAYAERGAVLSFSEAAVLTAQVHIAVRVGAGETVCGDTCRSFTDAHGNFYVVLSDGMGRGKRAALDSAMVCALTARLVRTGFSLECAVGAVNTALMMRATEETLATLDILRIDLTEGRAEFFKAGAAMSLARTGEKTAVIERSSLPLGILQEIRMERSAVALAPGDRVLLMSDGAAVLPPQHFRALFARMKKKSIKELAETAADEAMKYSPSGKHDDITVACVEIG